MAKTREWVGIAMFRAIIIRSETSVWEKDHWVQYHKEEFETMQFLNKKT